MIKVGPVIIISLTVFGIAFMHYYVKYKLETAKLIFGQKKHHDKGGDRA